MGLCRTCGHGHPILNPNGECYYPEACGCTPNDDIQHLMNLDLEYRLTIAHRIDCACAPYFVRRRLALIPAVLKQAKTDNRDPVNLFHEYALKVHEKLCINNDIPTVRDWQKENHG